MKSICFFNNKGGVGKTTLLCNVASYLATELGLRVIVVDADPQCNATQLILGEDTVQSMYKIPDLNGKKRKDSTGTLFDVLRPITIGESAIAVPRTTSTSSQNNFGVSLIAGHPQIALLEDRLSQAWLQLSGGDIGGARQTNWNTQLCEMLDSKYDVAFFDVGPSLGALNRSVLLGVDYFVTPMGCDVFSLLGVTNISQWLKSWFGRYQSSIDACKRAGFTSELSEFGIHENVDDVARFIGYTVQQYITKSKGGKRRPTVRYEAIRQKVPATVQTNLGIFIAAQVTPDQLELPDVPHMYSLVPLSQSSATPIHRLGYSEGLSGAQPGQKSEYVKFIKGLAESVVNNADLVS